MLLWHHGSRKKNMPFTKFAEALKAKNKITLTNEVTFVLKMSTLIKDQTFF